MGWFSKGVTTTLVGWSLYSAYRTLNVARIPPPELGEQLVSNVVKAGQEVDYHIYISTKEELDWPAAGAIQDTFLASRVIPTFGNTTLCKPSADGNTFHVLSFRARYGYEKNEESQWLESLPNALYRQARNLIGLRTPHPLGPTEATICNYTTREEEKNHLAGVVDDKDLHFALPEALRHQTRLFLIVLATKSLGVKADESSVSTPKNLRRLSILFAPVAQRLTTHLTPDEFARPKRFLLRDISGKRQEERIETEVQKLSRAVGSRSNLPRWQVLSIPREVGLGPVLTNAQLSRSGLAKVGLGNFVGYYRADSEGEEERGGQYGYLLPISVNSLTSPRDEFLRLEGEGVVAACGGDYVPQGRDQSPLTIAVKFRPIGLRAWLLQNIMVDSLNKLEEKFGFSTYDIDSLKIMMGGVNPLLIVSTFIVSALHLIFSFLALSSDVSYWTRDYKSAAMGMSRASVLMEIVMSLLIALYLLDIGQSMLVLLTAAGRTLLFSWKLWKLTHTRRGHGRAAPLPVVPAQQPLSETRLQQETEREDNKARRRLIGRPEPQTNEPSGQEYAGISKEKMEEAYLFERKWTWRLHLFLAPLVVAVCTYQLVYVPQAGWRSWLIHSLALCAYAGGFVAMTPQAREDRPFPTVPQLLRNYILQSVDHLPWATLTYQALNAFVDDFFAFIVRMPQMHRVSVFRDDIVFIIYIVQRRMYKKTKRV